MLHEPSGLTAYELWHGTVPDVTNFRTFGCKAFARIPDESRKKLEMKSQPGIYPGPEIHGTGYGVLIPPVLSRPS